MAVIPIIDTHLHLIYPQRFSYPWLSSVPAIDRAWTIEDYWQEAETLGITGALHMEVDVAEADFVAETRYVSTLGGIVGAVAGCRPEVASFAGDLEQLASMPAVRGLRRVLHQSPDDLSQSALFAENIRLLAQHALSFDLCLRADQLHLGLTLASRAPEVSFILDHCGIPAVAAGSLDPWRDDIRKLARLPNVNAKISGIVAYAGPDWTVETLQPYVEHIIDCFGWDRVVWGSDHPVVTMGGTLARWVDATRQIIAAASADEQGKLLNANARRIYRLED